MKIETASIKVMRSHDYCHFEVCLGSSEANTPEAVDELRKTAARLADKAVSQYKTAKINAERLVREKNNRERLIRQIERIRMIPEGERTINSQAELKAFDDMEWESFRKYDYEDEDDWQQDEDNDEEY